MSDKIYTNYIVHCVGQKIEVVITNQSNVISFRLALLRRCLRHLDSLKFGQTRPTLLGNFLPSLESFDSLFIGMSTTFSSSAFSLTTRGGTA